MSLMNPYNQLSPVWIWQRMISPHMADLAVQLSALGVDVTFVAEETISEERAKQGWVPPALNGVRLILVTSPQQVQSAVQEAPESSVHICQGIRSNGLIGIAQKEITRLDRQHWIVMETVDDSGAAGIAKRLVYSWLFKWKFKEVKCILATGHRTKSWIAARGVPEAKIFEFAYFLPSPRLQDPTGTIKSEFRFGFAGRLIPLKRADLLIRSLASLKTRKVRLQIIGAGPEEEKLRKLGEELMPNMIDWFGQKNIDEVPSLLQKLDCLVLPSRHDGWGAVVSEALMVGTPVICSDSCGASAAVLASNVGGVFSADKHDALIDLLSEAIDRGPQNVEHRKDLSRWASCLSSNAGAKYLIEILLHINYRAIRPAAPWLAQNVANSH